MAKPGCDRNTAAHNAQRRLHAATSAHGAVQLGRYEVVPITHLGRSLRRLRSGGGRAEAGDSVGFVRDLYNVVVGVLRYLFH